MKHNLAFSQDFKVEEKFLVVPSARSRVQSASLRQIHRGGIDPFSAAAMGKRLIYLTVSFHCGSSLEDLDIDVLAAILGLRGYCMVAASMV